MCSPLKCRAAEGERNVPGHSNGATFSDGNEKKKKRKCKAKFDKEGMSRRAIHRHSACGDVLKKKKKSDPKKQLLFLFRKVKRQFFEYITEKTFQAFGFCLAITINRW